MSQYETSRCKCPLATGTKHLADDLIKVSTGDKRIYFAEEVRYVLVKNNTLPDVGQEYYVNK